MANLLRETLAKFDRIGQRPEWIDFIGTANGKQTCTWDEFRVQADRDYDSGYGVSEVRRDLVIVFVDGTWLERREYDGSEWWHHCKCPTKHVVTDPITALFPGTPCYA